MQRSAKRIAYKALTGTLTYNVCLQKLCSIHFHSRLHKLQALSLLLRPVRFILTYNVLLSPTLIKEEKPITGRQGCNAICPITGNYLSI